MKAKNITLYIAKPEDQEVVDRARKLLAFYEDRSLGDVLIAGCRCVVEQYDGPEARSRA